MTDLQKKAVYEKRIVAFVDILGFKTLIEDSVADTTIRRKIKTAVDIIYEMKKEKADRGIEGIYVSTFSDSAVVSYPADQHDALFYLLIDIIHLQLSLGRLGIMIRGGIAIGDAYHNGNIVFGPAMNEAYQLESQVAFSPRVVIMKETLEKGIQKTTDHSKYAFKYNLHDIMNCVKPDAYNEDEENQDLFFVDFLRQDQELTDFGDEYYQWLKEFRVAIIEGLNRYSEASDEFKSMSEKDKTMARGIFKKYRWILNYWNSVVTDEKANLPVPDIDNWREFRENYKKLEIKKRYPYS